MPRIDLRPRKRPLQARSEATVETILDAAARVLARESLAGFNTNRVAEVAGVSVGSLYQYFPNKAALCAALIDRAQTALAEAVETCIAAHAGRPLVDTLHALAAVLIEQQFGRPLLAAALDHEERRLPVAARLRQAEARLGAAVSGLLERHAPELPVPPDATLVRDLFTITKALVDTAAEASRTPPPDLPQRLVRAVWGTLHAVPPPASSAAPTHRS
jgi:AcrR family transcriptional regulator